MQDKCQLYLLGYEVNTSSALVEMECYYSSVVEGDLYWIL